MGTKKHGNQGFVTICPGKISRTRLAILSKDFLKKPEI
jgi:hypothetical protein